MDGVKQDLVQKVAVTYFHRNAIIQATKVLYAELTVTTWMVAQFKNEDNILNMCKTLIAAAKQNVKIPKFVILVHMKCQPYERRKCYSCVQGQWAIVKTG